MHNKVWNQLKHILILQHLYEPWQITPQVEESVFVAEDLNEKFKLHFLSTAPHLSTELREPESWHNLYIPQVS